MLSKDIWRLFYTHFIRLEKLFYAVAYEGSYPEYDVEVDLKHRESRECGVMTFTVRVIVFDQELAGCSLTSAKLPGVWVK